MSKDIRSFFTVLSKKTGNSPATPQQKPNKKPPIIIDSDDDDVVKSTPEKAKKPQSKRRVQVISSDSEDEGKKAKKDSPNKKRKTSSEKPKKDEKPKLKPVNLEAFNRPIKQSEVKPIPKEDLKKNDKHQKKKDRSKSKTKKGKNPELGVHGDKDFEKTLEELDEDSDDTILMDNIELLDKTIEEALSQDITEQKPKESKLFSSSDIQKEKESINGVSNDVTATKEKPSDDNKTPGKTEKRPRENEASPTSKKKKKLEHKDSGLEEDGADYWDKKRYSAGLYVAYLHRGGPKHHGEKEYPKGKPNCLRGLTFLRTGVLDSLEGDEFGTLLTEHGGRVVHSVSKKVNYLVVGEDPGPAKLEKARKYNIPEISEDEFLDMILVKSGMKPRYAVKSEEPLQDLEDLGIGGSEEMLSQSDKKFPQSDESPLSNDIKKEKKSLDKIEAKKRDEHGDTKKLIDSSDKKENRVRKPNLKKLSDKFGDADKAHKTHTSNHKETKMETELKEEKLLRTSSFEKSATEERPKNECDDIKKESSEASYKSVPEPKREKLIKTSTENVSWTEKYKPNKIKGIIGQQDTNSNMNKLKRWLENWFKNQDPERRKKLPKPSQYNQYDGAYFKAALLSGSPGVGKTTTATLVAQELGFDIVEFNASDTRNKKLLHEEISHMMNSKTVAGFASGKKNMNQKRVLLMDEVDGMAGNEDRGGIAELINFIKTANFPIICMCNNRDLPKMRSLVNYCYGLKFAKPNVVQVRGAMMSICFKEGLTIKPDVLAQLIVGTGCDIRQTLNHLSMWSASEKSLSAETVQKESKKSQKDVVFGAWDVIKKVFNKSENKDMSLMDKSRLFFYDYSFGPMFVQENYISVEPDLTGSNDKALERRIRRHLTADCLSQSDLIESKIRNTNNWSLLDSQGYMCTVLPSFYLSGKMDQVRFPGWFGKNSQQKKCLRMTSELYTHARTSISGDKTSVRVDYAEPLMMRLITPLKEKQTDGIDETLEVMKTYSLLRDDLTNLCELMTSFFNKGKNPFDSVSSSVKAALTRKYNKTVVLSFAPPTASKKKKGSGGETEDFLGDEEDYSDEGETEDTVDTDTLIKVKNKPSQAGSSKASGSQKDSKSKGKSSRTGESSKSSKAKSKK